MALQQKIIHIDMDCFYAAVEVRDNPALRHLPVAVGGRPDRRGVLTTCNYRAREFGLRSAMSSAQALQRCPELVLLPVAMDKYRQVSAQLHEIFHEYTDLIEPLSLDEAYLDVSANTECHGSATLLANKIRADIQKKTQLTASAGIAPNKFLAKVASDWRKPNGQFTIAPAQINEFIRDLPINKIPGVGKVTAKKLTTKNLMTCGQLQQVEKMMLINWFGKFGDRLYDYCRGIDSRAVETSRTRKSVSVEHTFSHDLSTLLECNDELPQLFAQLQQRLQKYSQRKIHKQFVKIKLEDFSVKTKECVVEQLNFNTFNELLASLMLQQSKNIRLLGIGVRFIAGPTVQQQTLIML